LKNRDVDMAHSIYAGLMERTPLLAVLNRDYWSVCSPVM